MILAGARLARPLLVCRVPAALNRDFEFSISNLEQKLLDSKFELRDVHHMSIATKTGDAGETALMYGRRRQKMDRRVEAYGTVDELNAALGLARATTRIELLQRTILSIQEELVILMGELAVADEDRERYRRDGYQAVTATMVDGLTRVVDDLEQNHHISFKRWATPGTTLNGAALDVARTVCRRAERRVVGLATSAEYVNPESIRYLNRLSDVLWLLARYAEGSGLGAGSQ